MKKIAFYTLGCKVNQYETEAMSELFEKDGYTVSDFDDVCDVYVINTCTVTGMSDRKSRKVIRQAKKKNPDAIVAVTGCYAQTAPEEVRKIEGVNLIIGTNNRSRIVSLVNSLIPGKVSECVDDIMSDKNFEKLSITNYSDRTRAYIKIQEGCNQFCSYCIIPYARGPVRSRSREDILAEIRLLSDNGFREVILTGIHIASYFDGEGYTLAELIKDVNKIDKIERIRLGSIEPMTLNERFIAKIKDCNKLCRHFHLSLQSGCDETLERMNRKYTTAGYKRIVDSIREHFEDAAITTDIMVGFPGETDEEFAKTAGFVKEIGFADAHIFEYSPRKGTPAAEMVQITGDVKHKRSKAIEKITAISRDEFFKSQLGKVYTVLMETEPQKGIFEGKTDNYITVRVKSDADITEKFVDVQITEVFGEYVFGEMV